MLKLRQDGKAKAANVAFSILCFKSLPAFLLPLTPNHLTSLVSFWLSGDLKSPSLFPLSSKQWLVASIFRVTPFPSLYESFMLSTMAIEVCSEISSPIFSPRISFSHDIDKAITTVPKEEQQQQRSNSSLLDSSSDFDFCIVNNIKLELSSADELFSNGKILPVQIKQNPNNTPKENKETVLHLPHQSATKNTEKKRLKEFLEDSNAEDETNENEEKPQTVKSSWQFRRSSSLNLDSTTAARGMNLIRSLHFLSRSNSTGSAPNPKQTATPNQKQQQHLRKNQSTNSRRRSSSASSSSCSSSTTYYPYNTSPRSQKPSLRKSGSYGSNGVRISPVLNLPPPYISKVTVSFFGFGSLFCNGKLKKKKK